MIELLAPLGLIAAAAFALPVVIHFLRRAEEHELRFAALRWLDERARSSTRLRLHERLLLALRLLLLATIALLLALPVWRDGGAGGSPWIVVAPGVDAAAARAAVDAPDAEWHWLVPGYPAIDTVLPTSAAPLSSLVRELDATLPSATSLTIVVPEEVGGLDAERVRLGRVVEWRVLPGRSPAPMPRAAPAPIRVAVRYDAGSTQEVSIVRAVARAWETAGYPMQLDVAAAETPLPESAEWLFWLGGDMPESAEAWIAHGGVALVSQRSDETGSIVLVDDNGVASLRERQLGRGRLLSTSAALSVDALPALLSPDFPERLRALLSRSDTPPDRAAAQAMSPERDAERRAGPATPLDHALALCAALLFLLERLWATRARAWRS